MELICTTLRCIYGLFSYQAARPVSSGLRGVPCFFYFSCLSQSLILCNDVTTFSRARAVFRCKKRTEKRYKGYKSNTTALEHRASIPRLLIDNTLGHCPERPNQRDGRPDKSALPVRRTVLATSSGSSPSSNTKTEFPRSSPSPPSLPPSPASSRTAATQCVTPKAQSNILPQHARCAQSSKAFSTSRHRSALTNQRCGSAATESITPRPT